MKTVSPESFDKFSKVPNEVLTELTPGNSNEVLLSDDDIKATNEHTKTSLFPGSSEQPNSPIEGIGSANIPTSQPGLKLGSTVSGEFTVSMMDAILPALLVWVVSLLGYGIDKKTLQLSAKEKETLSPLFQAYLNSINVSFDKPLNNLLFGLAMIYGAKAVEVFPTATKIKKGAKEPDKTAIGKVIDSVKKNMSTDEIIKKISDTRKKGIKDAIDYFNKNKKKYGKEHEPDVKLPS